MEEKESIDVMLKILEYNERYLYISPKALWNKEILKETSYGRFIVDELVKLISDNENEDYEVIFDYLINKIDGFCHKVTWKENFDSKKTFEIMKDVLENIYYYVNDPLPYY